MLSVKYFDIINLWKDFKQTVSEWHYCISTTYSQDCQRTIRGDIPCYRNGKNLMFYKDEILEWVDSGRAQDY